MSKHIVLLLANGFEELEAAAFTDVMGWSRNEGLEGVELTTAALSPQVRGTWNFVVTPQLVIESADDCNVFDALAIPGGFEDAGYYQDAFSPLFLSVIQHFARKKKPVSSVCVGALPIAKSGVIKGAEATTYHLGGNARLNQLADFGALPVKRAICESGSIVTSCGPSTALDVAFGLLEKLTTRENRETVQQAMGFSPSQYQERIK